MGVKIKRGRRGEEREREREYPNTTAKVLKDPSSHPQIYTEQLPFCSRHT